MCSAISWKGLIAAQKLKESASIWTLNQNTKSEEGLERPSFDCKYLATMRPHLKASKMCEKNGQRQQLLKS
jgi:hypothetical protein